MKKLIVLLCCCFLIFSNAFSSFAANFYQDDLNCDSVYVVGKESNMAVVEKNIDLDYCLGGSRGIFAK